MSCGEWGVDGNRTKATGFTSMKEKVKGDGRVVTRKRDNNRRMEQLLRGECKKRL